MVSPRRARSPHKSPASVPACNLQRLLGGPAVSGTDAVTSPFLSLSGTSTHPSEAAVVVSSQLSVASSQQGGTGVSPVQGAPAAVGRGRRRWRWPAVAVGLALAAAAVFAGVIIIRIRDKQGHERTIEVADDAQISIEHKKGDGWRVTGDGQGGTAGTQETPGLSPPVTRHPSPVTAPPPPATRHPSPVTPSSRPFVLTRQGKPAGEFKTFAALWDMCQPGDEIVVRGDGPFVLPPLEIRDRALVLKAAPGCHPTFAPDPQLFNLINRGWIDLRQGSMTIEGCDFRMISPAYRGPVPLLSGEANGPCVVRNCRMLGFDGLTAPDPRPPLDHRGFPAESLGPLRSRLRLARGNANQQRHLRPRTVWIRRARRADASPDAQHADCR